MTWPARADHRGPRDASRLELAGILLLLLGGPFFFFPELIPSSLRALAVAFGSVAAFLVAIGLTWNDKAVRGLVAVLALTAVLGAMWLLRSETAVSHFSGLAVGVLAMSVVRSWGRTEQRLLAATAVFLAVGTAVVALALAGTWVRMVGPEIRPRVFPIDFNAWVPYISLDMMLPGIIKGAGVNKNALGASTLLVVPMAASMALLGWRSWLSRMVSLLALVTFVAGFYVFMVAESRSVWIAGWVVAVLASVRLLNGRRRWLAVVVLVALPVIGTLGSWVSNPVRFAGYVERMNTGTDSREDIWVQAVDRLKDSYGLGIGFSQFRWVRATTGVDVDEFKPVAHAHNIFLQTALDLGVAGMLAYIALLALLLHRADHVARHGGRLTARVAAGAGLLLVAVHVFGLGDAVALGARIGIFQWLAAGFILAAWSMEAGVRSPLGDEPTHASLVR